MNNLEFKMEQYVLGELSQKEMEEMNALIQKDASIAQRVELLKGNNEQLRQKFPVGDFSLKMHSHTTMLNSQGDKMKLFNIPVLSGVLSALVIVVFGITMVTSFNPSIFPVVEVTRLKGLDAQLNIYKKTPLGSTLMIDSAIVMSGDQFQIEYVISKHSFGVIYSIDGNGIVTHHLAGSGSEAIALASGKKILSYSYQLDEAPEYETFFLILSATSFDLDSLLDAHSHLIQQAVWHDEVFTIKNITLLKRN